MTELWILHPRCCLSLDPGLKSSGLKSAGLKSDGLKSGIQRLSSFFCHCQSCPRCNDFQPRHSPSSCATSSIQKRFLAQSFWRLPLLYRATLCVVRSFIPRDAMRSAVFAAPCVCPSVTFVYFIQTAEDIVKLLSGSGSPIILVFFNPERRYQIPRGTPSTVPKIHLQVAVV